MADRPDIKDKDWIYFGSGVLKKRAIVCDVRPPGHDMGDIEIVYLDDRDRAINDEMVWNSTAWEFKYKGPSGGYADRSDRLRPYVARLRAGPPS